MDSAPDAKPAPSAHWWMWIIAALALYVLSFGPAARYYMTSPGTKIEEGLVVAYTPILLLMEYTPLRSPFELYLRLWGVNF